MPRLDRLDRDRLHGQVHRWPSSKDTCRCRCAACKSGAHCHNMANGCHIRTWPVTGIKPA